MNHENSTASSGSEPSMDDKDKIIREQEKRIVELTAEINRLKEENEKQRTQKHMALEPIMVEQRLEEHPSLSYETAPDGRKIPYYTYNNLKIEQLIARGGYGVVDLCYDSFSNQHVILKRFQDINFMGNKREIEFLYTHSHENIVKFLGAVRSQEGCIGYVMEYIIGGSLHKDIYKSQVPYDMQLICQWVVQIGSPLKFLHDNAMIHRDLNPRNILLDANNILKLADFGFVRSINTDSKLTSGVGTDCYRAPEVLKSNEYGLPADIFSLGITIWEIIHRIDPTKCINYSQSAIELTVDQNRMQGEMPDFLKRCWSMSPEDRPNVADVIHFFRDFHILEETASRKREWSHNFLSCSLSPKRKATSKGLILAVEKVIYTDNLQVCKLQKTSPPQQKLDISWSTCERSDRWHLGSDRYYKLLEEYRKKKKKKNTLEETDYLPKRFMWLDPRLPILSGNIPGPQMGQTLGSFNEASLGKCRVIQPADSRRGQGYYLEMEHGQFGTSLIKYLENRNEIADLEQLLRDLGFNKLTNAKQDEHIRDKKREIMFASQLSHPNIMKVLGYISSTGKRQDVTGLIMEGAALGTLETYAKKSQLPDYVIKLYALQLADALRYCHDELHIIHRDVRPRNIYVHDNGESIKLGNFGYAREEDSEMKTANKGDELYYKAPEMIYSGNVTVYSYPVDVYGYALVIWCISHGGSRPFWDQNRMVCANSFNFRYYLEESNENRPPIREDLDPFLANVIRRCWVNLEAGNTGRPTMAEVVASFQ